MHTSDTLESRERYLSLLKEIKLDKARAAMKSLLFLPLSTLLFCVVTASYGLFFAIAEWGTWYLAFSGVVVAIFSVSYIVVSIRQLKQILSLDYSAPLAALQQDISQIKLLMLTNLRIAAWLLPFGPFIGLFLVKALFNFDLTTILGFSFIAAFSFITIVVEVFALVMLKAFRPENINSEWISWLLQGSGDQADKAIGFLRQIDE